MDHSQLLREIAEIRGVKGVFEVGLDGFLIKSLYSGKGDPESIAAEVAATMRAWKKIGLDLSMGNLKWLLLEYSHGNIIIVLLESVIVVVGSNKMISGEALIKIDSILSEGTGSIK
ncbi:MAG: roadblock/LC7 domain-containing protein [Chitinispirillaceae bacterium]|nr:roadblock/LC7 domain-containing protein [Chitinispirillaceae bacterium]